MRDMNKTDIVWVYFAERIYKIPDLAWAPPFVHVTMPTYCNISEGKVRDVAIGLVTASPHVALNLDSGVTVLAAEAAGVSCNHMVCRSGLQGYSLLLHTGDVVLFDLLGAALHSNCLVVQRISEALP
jgi:hypothetical protein